MATTLTATLSLDTTAANAQWTTTKNLAKTIPDKINAAQATFSQIAVTGAPGPSGTVTFTVNHAQTDSALADLRSTVQQVLDDIDATQSAVNALAPTVTNVA
jgi:hypothetical protein